MPRRGLVIGKFLPPHAGHHHLINTARSQADEVTIIVCARGEDEIDASLRAAWLREIHPDTEVLIIEDTLPPDDSRLWAEHTVHWLGSAPDVVFTSEDYGETYARFMGCEHVLVDRERRTVPCSGTAVRRDPIAQWHYLEPPVRAHYAVRICVLGAESTGTTTLANAIGVHYRSPCVPEYGRTYWMKKQVRGEEEWTEEEFIHIAETQLRMEDAAARRADPLLILDTDAFTTCLWHEYYRGYWSERVEGVSANRPMDLYLLTDVDIPFVQDGTREGEHLRLWMHGRFIEELTRRGKPFVLLSGTHADRMAKAVTAIEALPRVHSGSRGAGTKT